MSKKYFHEAIKNIRDDRAVTSKLLLDIINYIGSDNDKHKDVGAVVAKYLETLQRSNEQLVKIAAIIQKRESKTESISDSEVEELFDLINDSSKEEEE